jgi:hypothetical protein
VRETIPYFPDPLDKASDIGMDRNAVIDELTFDVTDL